MHVGVLVSSHPGCPTHRLLVLPIKRIQGAPHLWVHCSNGVGGVLQSSCLICRTGAYEHGPEGRREEGEW